MRLYKPSYTRKGNTIESPTWWLDFRWRRQRCRLPAFASRKQSDTFARRVTELMATLASGETPDQTLVKWMQNLTPQAQKHMMKYGLLEGRFAATGKPLSEHLRDWKAVMLARGNTAHHAERFHVDATRILQLARVTFLAELLPSRVQSALDAMRRGESGKRELSLQTLNHALRAIKTFTRWLVSDRRAVEDPLAHMKGFNVRTDLRHTRRALSEDEIAWLIESTAKSAARCGIPGIDRAMLYHLALTTGLRRGELTSLTPKSFQLRVAPPVVIVKAAYSKHRKEDTQPLPVELAALLRPWLASRTSGQKIWPRLQQSSRMLKRDLHAARERWIDEARDAAERNERVASDFLLAENHDGQVIDFHALRHTFITRLVNAGLPVKVAQDLARHSTPTLTLARYAHLERNEISRALATVPALPTEAKPERAEVSVGQVPHSGSGG